MIKRLLSFLGLRKVASPSDEDPFTVEHYPLTGKFFPKAWGRLMDTHHITGIIKLCPDDDFYLIYADGFKTEAEAWRHVDKFKEQRLKENVKVLRR